jgi:hypothetical protein
VTASRPPWCPAWGDGPQCVDIGRGEAGLLPGLGAFGVRGLGPLHQDLGMPPDVAVGAGRPWIAGGLFHD